MRFHFDLQVHSRSARIQCLRGSDPEHTGFAGTTTRDGSSVAGERAEPLRSGSATLNVVTPDLSVTKSDGVTTAAPGASRRPAQARRSLI